MTTAAYTVDWWDLNEADIVFFDFDSVPFLNTPLSPAGVTQASSFDLDRTIIHEMGHSLGLGHPNAPRPFLKQTAPNPCVPGGASAVMCQTTKSPTWDIPAVDDISGIRDPLIWQKREQRIGLVRGFFQPTVLPQRYDFIFIEDTGLTENITSIARPRISCQHGTQGDDCVVAVTTDTCPSSSMTDCVRLVALSHVVSDDTWRRTDSVTLPNASSHEVDVAMDIADDGDERAVLVRMDGADRNVWWTRWVPSWVLVPPANISQAPLVDADGGVLQTRTPPRVAWNEVAQRFVILFTDPARNFLISISLDREGSTWTPAVPVTYTDAPDAGIDPRRSFGYFDFSCPVHDVRGSECRLVYSDIGDQPISRGNANARQLASVCRFTVNVAPTGPTASPFACTITDVTGIATESINDMSGLPLDVPQDQAWLLTLARGHAFADAGPGSYDTNTVAVVAQDESDSSGNIFPVRRSRFLGNSAVSVPIGHQPSVFGGMSCDYLEAATREECVQFVGGTW